MPHCCEARRSNLERDRLGLHYVNYSMAAFPNLSECEKCLAVIAHGARMLHDGDLKQAEPSFYAALALSQSATPEEARKLLPLTLYCLSLLRHRQSRADESRQLREQATKHLDDQTASFRTRCSNI